jgi:hypothetical protein
MPADRSLDRRRLLRLGLTGLAAGAVAGLPMLADRATSSARDGGGGGATANGGRRGPRRRARPEASLAIVGRAEWGADEGLRSREIEFDPTVEKFVVHHTGTDLGTDSVSTVRELYRSTVASGYRDIPYHWLIDPDGVVFEGRWARPVPSGRTPNGEDDRGWCVRGGHALHYNDRSIGVAYLGNFVDRAPTNAATDALVSLLAWKCERWGVDPTGATRYRLNDGSTQRFPNICGHRQVRATLCPGPAVADALPGLRVAVGQRLGGTN